MNNNKVPYNVQHWLNHLNHWLDSHTTHNINYRVGIDTGVGSRGLSVIEDDKKGNPKHISYKFSQVFDKGTVPKNEATKNSKRRSYRHEGTSIDRTRNRRKRVNILLARTRITSYRLQHKARRTPANIYRIRVAGLNHKLSPMSFYRIAYFFAAHRGFKNIRVDTKAKGKLKKAINNTSSELAQWQHKYDKKYGHQYLGEMMYYSKRFRQQKRNRHNMMLCMPTRDESKAELKAILSYQMKVNSRLSPNIAKRIMAIIFSQRTFDEGKSKGRYAYKNGLMDLVGLDPFKPTIDNKNNYVISEATATFEKYRLLQKLDNLKYGRSHPWQKLTDKQINSVMQAFGKCRSLTDKQVKKLIGIPANYHFNYTHETKFADMSATYSILKCLPASLLDNKKINEIDDIIDEIGTTLTKYTSPRALIQSLSHIKSVKLSTATINKLIDLESKASLSFSTFGSLSKWTISKIMRYMYKGVGPTEALYASGLVPKHIEKTPVTYEDLRYMRREYKNPIQIRSFHVILKGLSVIINHLGKPDFVFIEDGRSISNADRNRICDGQLRNEKRNEKYRRRLIKKGLRPTRMLMLKWRLYEQQHGLDMYTGRKMSLYKVLHDPKYSQVDHIQPIGSSWNNSYNNKTLTVSKCNYDKGKRTPIQWMRESLAFSSSDIRAFKQRVWKFFGQQIRVVSWKKIKPDKNNVKRQYHKLSSQHYNMWGKRKHSLVGVKRNKSKKIKSFYVPSQIEPVAEYANFLRITPRQAIDSWQPRDLVNNQTLALITYHFLRKHLVYRSIPGVKQHTYVTSGTVTSMLRHAWGLVKIRPISDSHHGIDAALIAVSGPKLRSKVDRFYKLYGETGIKPHFPEPYKGFLKELTASQPITNRLTWYHDKTKALFKDSVYSAKHLSIYGPMQHRPITDISRASKGRDKHKHYVIGTNKGTWRLIPGIIGKPVYSAIDKALKNRRNGKAFPNGYLQYGRKRYYKVPLFKTTPLAGWYSRNYKNIKPYAGITRTDVWKDSKGKYHNVTIYPLMCKEGYPKTDDKNKQLKGYRYQFCLHHFTPVLIQFSRKRKLKFGAKSSIKVSKRPGIEYKVGCVKGHMPCVKIDGKKYGGNSYSAYYMTDKEVPHRDNIDANGNHYADSKGKAFLGRITNEKTFIGYVRRATSDGSVLIQPFDLTSLADDNVSVSVGTFKKFRILHKKDYFGGEYYAF